MKDLDRISHVLEYITESHLDMFGGYPYDYEVIGDELVVAELDAGKDMNATRLCRYPMEALLKWELEASEYRIENDSDWTEACGETQPDFSK